MSTYEFTDDLLITSKTEIDKICEDGKKIIFGDQLPENKEE